MGAGVEQRVAEEGIGRSAASGVLWLAAQKWAVRFSGFATLVVLTRTVTPREFGVVAAAMTFVPMIYLLSDLGFSTYLLQAPQVDRRSLSTAFWASVAAGAVLSTGLWLVAPLVAQAFRSPDLVPVLRALVLSVVPTVLAGVPLAMLRRSMRFRAVAVQALVAALLAQGVAVVVALRGGGVWALVSQVVVTQWVIAVLAWGGARWVPSFWLSPRQFREMASFGLRVSSVDLVAMSRMWGESWVVTVTLGPTALGLLNIAQRLVQVAQELTAASLVPVSTVVFSRVRHSRNQLVVTYVKALGVGYSVVSPFMILILVTAPALVPLLFGNEWHASVAPSQALAVAGIITLGAMLDHGLFYGLGRPGSWLAYAVVVDAATLGTTAVAVHFGLTGVAVGFIAVATLATVARWFLVGRLLGLSTRAVARPFVTVLLPTAVTAAVGTAVFHLLSGTAWPWLSVLLTAAVTVFVHVVMLRLMAANIVRDAVGVVPVPERYADRVRRSLRLHTVGAS
jgi:O-antigen/teichoic acid export membrane protein